MATTAPLITGWEPDLPVEDSILRRFVFCSADRLARMASAAGGHIAGSHEAAFADPGSPFLFDNGVVLLQPPTAALLDSVMRQARRFFPSDRAWVLLSVWPTPDLRWRGLDLVGHPPLMLRPPGKSGLPPSPPELRVLEVDSPASLADFEHVLVAGYPMPAGSGVVSPDLLGSVIRLYVGYLDGVPVAVSGAAAGHGLLEIDWVATLPQTRGRGFGTAMTARAVRSSPELPAVLLASDDGQRLYDALGFLPLLRATVWSHAPAALPRARKARPK